MPSKMCRKCKCLKQIFACGRCTDGIKAPVEETHFVAHFNKYNGNTDSPQRPATPVKQNLKRPGKCKDGFNKQDNQTSVELHPDQGSTGGIDCDDRGRGRGGDCEVGRGVTELPRLTPGQVALLQTSWKLIRNDMAVIGLTMFIR